MIVRCLLAAVLVLSLSASMATATEAPAEPATPASEPAPSVTPIKKSAAAPFTGLLVPEDRFTELLRAELKAQELEGKLSIQEQTTQALEAMYLSKLEQATEPVPWYRTESFNRWVGFGLGVAFTGLAVWGAVEFGKAIE